jgi:putative ABC transport system substrate-binding protein
MNVRRTFLAIFLVAAVAVPPAASAQPATKMPRLCFLTFDPGTTLTTRYGVFFQGLRDLGRVDGQTITIDYLSAEGRGERFPELAGECLRRRADIIVATTTPAAQAAKEATRTIPIVMLNLAVDPTETGLVSSLARPGGNITGQTSMAPELGTKRLELLKEAVPGLSRVLLLSYLVDPIAPPQIRQLENAAGKLGLKLQLRDIRSADDLPAAFAAGQEERAEGLLTTTESLFFVNRARVIELAAKYKLPAAYPHLVTARDGGLMAYSQDPDDVFRRAAVQVDRILKGAKPADLPVEQPTRFVLVINLKTAKALSLTVPQSILARADEVIE